jgi:polar amino acid transport system substrate-binding protein
MKSSKIMFVFIALVFLIARYCFAETVKIIAEDDWYPYSGLTGHGAEGIAVDIVRETFKAEGIDVEFEVMNYDRSMALVNDGQAIGCFDAPRTQEIEKMYYWHDEPMFTASSYFYSTSDYAGQISNIKDIGEKKLGLTQGYGYGDAIDMDDGLSKEYSKSDEIILKKLIAGRLDFIVLYDRVAGYLISKLNARGRIKPVGLSESADIYVAFSRKHPDGKKYCDIFSSGFRKIKDNGTYQRIWEAWDARFNGSASLTPTE